VPHELITLERATSEDGDKRWHLVLRADGLYSYHEDTLEPAIFGIDDDGAERELAAPARWFRSYVSGLFESAISARIDAVQALPWLERARARWRS